MKIVYHAAQADKQHAEELRDRERPWLVPHYEEVRRAAIALVRTHQPLDLPNGEIRASVDGAALWELLGALDRAKFAH